MQWTGFARYRWWCCVCGCWKCGACLSRLTDTRQRAVRSQVRVSMSLRGHEDCLVHAAALAVHVNYLDAADAALRCGRPVTAILCTELWCLDQGRGVFPESQTASTSGFGPPPLPSPTKSPSAPGSVSGPTTSPSDMLTQWANGGIASFDTLDAVPRHQRILFQALDALPRDDGAHGIGVGSDTLLRALAKSHGQRWLDSASSADAVLRTGSADSHEQARPTLGLALRSLGLPTVWNSYMQTVSATEASSPQLSDLQFEARGRAGAVVSTAATHSGGAA